MFRNEIEAIRYYSLKQTRELNSEKTGSKEVISLANTFVDVYLIGSKQKIKTT